MIYTLTLNPSIDYYVKLDTLIAGGLNRSLSEAYKAGGKGINVSLMLSAMGVQSIATGFVGGFTGDEIIRTLDEKGIRSEFVRIQGQISRINIKAGSAGGLETEINGRGLSVSEDDLDRLSDTLNRIERGDILVMSGSLCDGLSNDIYAGMVSYASDRGAIPVVDASGELLMKAVKSGPFLIKPNLTELIDLYRDEINSARSFGSIEDYRSGLMITEDIIEDLAHRLQKNGAKNVLVSMGENGAMLIADNGKTYRQPIPDTEETTGTGKAGEGIVSTVGAGDSLLAGFIAEYFFGSGDYETSLLKGVTVGTETARGGGLHI